MLIETVQMLTEMAQMLTEMAQMLTAVVLTFTFANVHSKTAPVLVIEIWWLCRIVRGVSSKDFCFFPNFLQSG